MYKTFKMHSSSSLVRLPPAGLISALIAASVLVLSIGAGAVLANFTQVSRTVSASVLVVNPADVNLDRTVDSADLLQIAAGLGADLTGQDPKTRFTKGDTNLDGRVDVLDLALVGVNFSP